MKRIIVIALAIVLFALMSMSAKTLRLGNIMQRAQNAQETIESIPPTFHYEIAEDSTSVTFTFKIPTVDVNADNLLYPNSYSWELAGFSHPVIAGTASLPQTAITVRIPATATNIRLIENRTKWQTISGYTPTPSRPAIPDGTCYTLDNVPPIISNTETERAVATIAHIGQEYDEKIVVINITPFKYASCSGNVDVCYDFSISVSFDTNDSDSTTDDTLCESISPLSIPAGITLPTIPGGKEYLMTDKEMYQANYLIITTPEYKDKMVRYGDWRKKFGHRYRIATRSSWTTKQIQDTIKKEYQSDKYLRYVIFAGGIQKIPAQISPTYAYGTNPVTKCLTDYHYACLGGDEDLDRDIFTGRFLANTPQEMENIITKLMSYYNESGKKPGFYNHATHISYFDINDRVDVNTEKALFVKTSEDIRNQVKSAGKTVNRVYTKHTSAYPKYWDAITGNRREIPSDLKIPQFYWDGDANDITANINNGNFYVLFRGHGVANGWDYPTFGTDKIATLNNANNLPIIFSIGCNTGNFTNENGFAKALLTSPNGAAAVIASEEFSYSGFNDAIALGIFGHLFNAKQNSNTTVPPQKDPNTGWIVFTPDISVLPGKPSPLDVDFYALGVLLHKGQQRMDNLCPYTLDLITSEVQNGGTGIDAATHKLNHKELYHIFGDPGFYLNTETPTKYEDVHISLKEDPNNPSFILLKIPMECKQTFAYNNISTGATVRFATTEFKMALSKNDVYTISLIGHNKIPFTFTINKGIISADGSFINDTQNTTQPYIATACQVAPDAIDVSYDITDSDTDMPVPANVELISLNNNEVLVRQHISESGNTTRLQSDKLRPGIYVVRIITASGVSAIEKVLIK